VEVPTVVKPMWTAPQPPVKAKMILLGESGVGKTSLVYAYKYGSELLPCKPTIGAHYANFELFASLPFRISLKN
jgi:GTPase SAR1 family protein